MIKKIWSALFSKKFILFLSGGGISYLLKAVLSWFLSEKLVIPFSLSYGITLSVVILYNFTYNVLVTFRVKNQLKTRFIKYLMSIVVFNSLDYGLVLALEAFAPWSYQISIFLVTGFIMLIKYFVYNKWIFSERKNLQSVE